MQGKWETRGFRHERTNQNTFPQFPRQQRRCRGRCGLLSLLSAWVHLSIFSGEAPYPALRLLDCITHRRQRTTTRVSSVAPVDPSVASLFFPPLASILYLLNVFHFRDATPKPAAGSVFVSPPVLRPPLCRRELLFHRRRPSPCIRSSRLPARRLPWQKHTMSAQEHGSPTRPRAGWPPRWSERLPRVPR